MKFGYLRRDDDGHDYLIPESEIQEFDAFEGRMDEFEDSYDFWDAFEARWGQYLVGGSTADLKVVMPDD